MWVQLKRRPEVRLKIDPFVVAMLSAQRDRGEISKNAFKREMKKLFGKGWPNNAQL